MYPEIEGVLTRCGYQMISLNVVGVSLSVKQFRDRSYVVVTVDETTGTELSREQFVHISEQIRDFLRKRGSYYNEFLYLLISENDRSAKRLFESFESYWRIIPTERKLLVYESENREFNELRPWLEELFPGEFRQGGYESQREFRQSGYGSQREFRQGGYGNQRRFWQGGFGRFPLGNGLVPWVNLSIVLVNVLVFFLTDFIMFQDNSIVEWGALNWHLVFEEGQWYRLLTSMFLHGGIQHISSNMMMLLYMGSFIEQQTGKMRYGIIYFGSGILAGLVSIGYNMSLNENVYSLGASGAIFGIVGALLYFVLFQKQYSSGFNVRQIAVILIFSLYSGLADQGIDNAAHIGGFLSGFFIAALLGLVGKGRFEKFGGST